MIIMETFWPYYYNEERLMTKEWQRFLDIYDTLCEFYNEENEDMCETTIHLMALFLKDNKDKPQFIKECIEYLSEMPWDWLARLLIHIINKM